MVSRIPTGQSNSTWLERTTTIECSPWPIAEALLASGQSAHWRNRSSGKHDIRFRGSLCTRAELRQGRAELAWHDKLASVAQLGYESLQFTCPHIIVGIIWDFRSARDDCNFIFHFIHLRITYGIRDWQYNFGKHDARIIQPRAPCASRQLSWKRLTNKIKQHEQFVYKKTKIFNVNALDRNN